MTQAQATAAKKAVKKNTNARAAQPKTIQTRRDRSPEFITTLKNADGSTRGVLIHHDNVPVRHPAPKTKTLGGHTMGYERQPFSLAEVKASVKRQLAPTYTTTHLWLTGVSVAVLFLTAWVVFLIVW